MIRLISHCHTHHSFDSSMQVTSIISEAVKHNVNAIIINDHDVFSLSTIELKLFNENNIAVLPAIEFTTAEGVHVIGVHDEIKLIQSAPFYYSILGLIDALKKLSAKIIFPHPFHATGVYGNRKISDCIFESLIQNGDGVEVDNYRYGLTPASLMSKIIRINPEMIRLIGSDAHTKGEVAAFVNEYAHVTANDLLDVQSFIFTKQPFHLKLKRRSKLYFRFKKIQKTTAYQYFLNLVSARARARIKSIIRFGK